MNPTYVFCKRFETSGYGNSAAANLVTQVCKKTKKTKKKTLLKTIKNGVLS